MMRRRTKTTHKAFMICSALALIMVTQGAFPRTAAAGSKELFEAKLAAEALEGTVKRTIGNSTPNGKLILLLSGLTRSYTVRAYGRCPDQPSQAREFVMSADYSLESLQFAVDILAHGSAEGLGEQIASLAARYDDLLAMGTICDQGAHTLQTELSYEQVAPFAKFATVWGDRTVGAHGTFGEFIPGGESPPHVHSHSYHGVVLSGTVVNPFSGDPIDQAQPLQAGDYWFVPANVEHVTACVSAEPCLFYFHSEGLFDFLIVE